MTAYSQCETYLQKAEVLFTQKNYKEAKKQYLNYQECKPNAPGIDVKITECDRLQKEEDTESNNTNGSYRVGSRTKATTTEAGNSNNAQTTEIQPVERSKTAIGIGNFSGYKNDQYESAITTAFTDGRFIVSKTQNSRYGSSQATSNDVDFIVSGTSTLKQREQRNTTYTNGGKYLGNIPISSTIPEVVEIALTITDAKTGQILSNQTWNANSIYGFVNAVFPVECQIISINKKEMEMVTIGGGRVFEKEVFNIYETQMVNGYTRKNKIGKLKVTGFEGDFIKCKLTEGAKDVDAKFKFRANLLIQK